VFIYLTVLFITYFINVVFFILSHYILLHRPKPSRQMDWSSVTMLSCFFACSSEYVTIRFKDVGVQLEQKTLIKHVYGTVKPTQTLAIMGPSGKMQDLSYVNRKIKSWFR